MPSDKRIKIILIAVGLGAVIYFFGTSGRNKQLSEYGGGQKGAVNYKTGFKEYKEGFVTVRKILANTETSRNNLKTQGVVDKVFFDKSIFLLSDVACGQDCGSLCTKESDKIHICNGSHKGCRGGKLTVKLGEVIGKMPVSGDVVSVFGRIETDKRGKRQFLAGKVRKLGTLAKP